MSNLHFINSSFTDWYLEPLGQELAALEYEQIQRLWSPGYGHYVLQLGSHSLLSKLAIKKPAQALCLSQDQVNSHLSSVVQGRYHQLPFPNGSIDIVLLPHILELEAEVQPILAEAWRVLSNNGQLLILGFNPWSLWGLKRIFSGQHSYQNSVNPWNSYFHSGEKLRRDIGKMGGEIVTYKDFFFRPPINNRHFLVRSRWLEKMMRLLFPTCGGVYLLVVKKSVAPLTPIKAGWRWQTILENNKGLEPTTRRMNCD